MQDHDLPSRDDEILDTFEKSLDPRLRRQIKISDSNADALEILDGKTVREIASDSAVLEAFIERARQAMEAQSKIPEAEPVKSADDRTGRNELCPCGSGKKFKKCCGKRS
jgi:preprotein translocase subunit SecA